MLLHMINFCHFYTGNGWFLDKVVIKCDEGEGNQEVVFPCNRYVVHGEKKEFVKEKVAEQTHSHNLDGQTMLQSFSTYKG